jgi:hypothetical protein
MRISGDDLYSIAFYLRCAATHYEELAKGLEQEKDAVCSGFASSFRAQNRDARRLAGLLEEAEAIDLIQTPVVPS